MTTYNNLPVYKTSYDLLLEVFEVVKTFSREYKYTLWDSLRVRLVEADEKLLRLNFEVVH